MEDFINNTKESSRNSGEPTSSTAVASANVHSANEAHLNKEKHKNEVFRITNNTTRGLVRVAEDNLTGPYGKKRCADRYDSSESSDSGVAVSCGECSSSGISDITEPGSPCSTSSDEGLAHRGKTSNNSLRSLSKLASNALPTSIEPKSKWSSSTPNATVTTHRNTNSQELTANAILKLNINDMFTKTRTSTKTTHQESQGKITEYFKTQIKPHTYKQSLEFRKPLTVQRSLGTSAKQLNTLDSNNKTNDWNNVKSSITNPSTLLKKLSNITPRVNVTKLDKMIITRSLPNLTNDVYVNNDSCLNDSSKSALHCKTNGTDGQITTAPNSKSTATSDFESTINAKNNKNKNGISSSTNSNHAISIKSYYNNDEECGAISRLPTNHLLIDSEIKDQDVLLNKEEEDEDEDDEEDSSRSSESTKQLDSPILSTPTTIRFPARITTKSGVQTSENGICRWDKCDANFECSSALLEHLQSAHINTQTGGDNFVCHWLGCKVQGRTSCSKRWLERHVLSHGGNKPFSCIVDGCGHRFSSQVTLERHVNSHFNHPETNNNPKRNCENSGKLVRRNGKKLRYRRQPWSARIFDYFDTGVMEGLQHRLLELAKSRTHGFLVDTPGNSMALTSQVLAKRVEMDGKIRVLLRWHPQNIVPDEWVLESEVQSMKHIEIRKAAINSSDEVSVLLYPAMQGGAPPLMRVKQRRKPTKCS